MAQIKRIINIVKIEKFAVFGNDESGHLYGGKISLFPNVKLGQTWEITSEENTVVETKPVDKS
jgi:hypothetical protein